MASVYQKAGKFYMRVKDHNGQWRDRVTKARTKTEARRLAEDVERKAERQRLGLEELPPEDGGGTLAELLRWWLDTYSVSAPAHRSNKSAVERHLLTSSLARIPLNAVTDTRVEAFLQEKERELAPQTVNHLRGFISRAFNAARKVGRYKGANPVALVAKRAIPRSVGDYLRTDEVPRLFGALDVRWHPLFAAALYSGLRKGELAGLRKVDVDLAGRRLTIRRSWERETTKGGHADVIPIASELVPFLAEAIRRSPSELVFPAEDGAMMRRDVALEDVLRRAMGRAGMVTGYVHVCRRKGCGHGQAAQDAEPRKCPACRMSLWPKPQVRPLRFHDLRHTTATLLLEAGVPLAVVQRILRHRDPRITAETYGHLAPDYLRSQVDRLAFGLKVRPAWTGASFAEAAAAPVAEAPLAATLLQGAARKSEGPKTGGEIPQRFRALLSARDAGFEPAAFGSGGQRSIQLS